MAGMLKGFGFGLGPWAQKRIVDPLLHILRRGAEPKQLAFSGALGITLGVFPICGITVFLCGMAIAVLGSLCHAPTVMLTNFIATPVELSYARLVARHMTVRPLVHHVLLGFVLRSLQDAESSG